MLGDDSVTREEMLQDLAYARTLAEEGKHAPLIGGGYLVLFGVLLAIAYSAQWAALAGFIPTAAIGFIWMGFGLFAFIGCFMLGARTRSMPGGSSLANQADRSVWQGVAIGIFCVVAGTIIRGVVSDDMTAPNAIMAAGFGMYGIALFTTGCVSNQKWLQTFAWIAWAVSIGLWYFLNDAWTYLLAAGAAAVVLIIPGVILLRREPSTTV
jgi:hypothetical protein